MLRNQEIVGQSSFAFNFFVSLTVLTMFVTTCLWEGLKIFLIENRYWALVFGFIGGPFPAFFNGQIVLLIIISVTNLRNFVNRQQRVYSTVYAVLDIFLHQVILSILLFPWVEVFKSIYAGDNGVSFILTSLLEHHWVAYTWLPLTQIFLIKISRESPDELSDYLFIPMRRRFVPWIHLMFSMMVFQFKQPMLIATAFGYIEMFLLQNNIAIRFPLVIYGVIEKFLPKAIKLSQNFVLIEQCFFDQLKSACKFCRYDCSYDEAEEEQSRNQPSNPELRQKWLKMEDQNQKKDD